MEHKSAREKYAEARAEKDSAKPRAHQLANARVAWEKIEKDVANAQQGVDALQNISARTRSCWQRRRSRQ